MSLDSSVVLFEEVERQLAASQHPDKDLALSLTRAARTTTLACLANGNIRGVKRVIDGLEFAQKLLKKTGADLMTINTVAKERVLDLYVVGEWLVSVGNAPRGKTQMSARLTFGKTDAYRELGISRETGTKYQKLPLAMGRDDLEIWLEENMETKEITFDGALRAAQYFGLNPALFSSDSPEWYTPSHIIYRVLKVLGIIDLDPCSNSHEEPNVPARLHYTSADDGLAQIWEGKVYMNPPYGQEIPLWVERLVEEYRNGSVIEAITLVPSRTDTEWFKQFREFPRCFIWGRLKFSENLNSAPFPSAVVYLGLEAEKFADAFKDIGDVYALYIPKTEI